MDTILPTRLTEDGVLQNYPGWRKYCDEIVSVCGMLDIAVNGFEMEYQSDNHRVNTWLSFKFKTDSAVADSVLSLLVEDLKLATKLTCEVCGEFSRRFPHKGCKVSPIFQDAH